MTMVVYDAVYFGTNAGYESAASIFKVSAAYTVSHTRRQLEVNGRQVLLYETALEKCGL